MPSCHDVGAGRRSSAPWRGSALFAGLLGAAVFHTQLAERQLRIDRLDRAVAEQRELFDELRYERAELRSPVRLAEAAGAMGMGAATRATSSASPPRRSPGSSPPRERSIATSRVIVETDPLQQFRDVKAVTAGELSDAANGRSGSRRHGSRCQSHRSRRN